MPTNTVLIDLFIIFCLFAFSILTFPIVRDILEKRRLRKIEKEMDKNEANFRLVMQALGLTEDPAGKILEMTSDWKLVWIRKPGDSKVETGFRAELADGLRLECVKTELEMNFRERQSRIIGWSIDFFDAQKRFYGIGINYWDHCRGEDGISGDRRVKELYDFLEAKYGT